MGTVWAMKAFSVAGAQVQSNKSITFHSLLPFVFPLTPPPPRLQPLLWISGPGLRFNSLFLGMIQWWVGSHPDKAWPLISLTGASLVPWVPLCPLCHL